MAKAVTKIQPILKTQEQEREEALQDLADWLVEHREDLQSFLDLISALKASGLLAMVTALLTNGQEIVKIIVDQTKQPSYAGGIKNVIALIQGFGALDASMLTELMGSLVAMSHHVDLADSPKVAGVWSTLQAVRDPDVAKGFSAALGLMRALGLGIREREAQQNETP